MPLRRIGALAEEQRKIDSSKERGGPTSNQSVPLIVDEYHPTWMFCGECTSCALPPPPVQQQRISSNNSLAAMAASPPTPIDGVTATVRSTFHVSRICCSSEIPPITKLLGELSGVDESNLRFNLPLKLVYVHHDPSLTSASRIKEALNNGMFGATLRHDGGKGFIPGEPTEEEEMETDTVSLHWNVILSGIFWICSMIGMIGVDFTPPSDPNLRIYQTLQYSGLLAVCFGLPPVLAKAYHTITRRQFDANCMMVVAALGALALREYDEAASVAFLFSVSDYLEHRATTRARLALGGILSRRPPMAVVREDGGGGGDGDGGGLRVVRAVDVAVGAVCVVKPGDRVPCDGIIIEGTNVDYLVDESSLTGESTPIPKRSNDVISGGSLNIGSYTLTLRTTHTSDQSTISRLINLVEESTTNSSPTAKLIDRFAQIYTPVVALLAVSLCTFPWLWGSEVGSYWTLNGLIVIVVACPCALTISTPVTYAAGLAATARKGIIVKGGVHLENLGKVKHVVFDKTGTLTMGKFALVHLTTVPRADTNGTPTLEKEATDRRDMLTLLSLLESSAAHPLGATLVHAAQQEHIYPDPANYTVSNHTLLHGEGVSATINDEEVFVGNERLFQRLSLYEALEKEIKDDARMWTSSGGTVGYVGSMQRGILGMFCVMDQIRPEAREVVKQLQSLGLEITMLTGDSHGAAMAIGRQVGLLTGHDGSKEDAEGVIRSRLLPEDKLAIINDMVSSSNHTNNDSHSHAFHADMEAPTPNKRCGCLQCCSLSTTTRGLTLMCGDGVNDAPAMAAADIGVAMGEHGAALALEMSDATLMDSDLRKLVYAITMGKRVLRTIQENILFSLFTKGFVVILTFMGKMTLLSAIATDIGVMLLVTLNGMKLIPRGMNDDGLEDSNSSGTKKMSNERKHRDQHNRDDDSTSWAPNSESESTHDDSVISDWESDDHGTLNLNLDRSGFTDDDAGDVSLKSIFIQKKRSRSKPKKSKHKKRSMPNTISQRIQGKATAMILKSQLTTTDAHKSPELVVSTGEIL